jgi:hypothetical protein
MIDTMHPVSRRFHALLAELGALHDLKQQDYGLDDDPLANVRGSTAWGIPSWVGAMVRATDKVKRLQTFAIKGTLANESVIDAFNDLAVYAIIGRILYEEEPLPLEELTAALARSHSTDGSPCWCSPEVIDYRATVPVVRGIVTARVPEGVPNCPTCTLPMVPGALHRCVGIPT